MSSQTTGLDKQSLDLVLQSIRDFAKEHLPEKKLLQLDEEDQFPEELVRRMGGGDLGLQLLFIPEQYGGMGGGAFDVYRVCEAMGRIDLGVATGVLATFLGSDPIVFGATEEQKQLWLGRIASEGLLFAYGATEPQAGSDLGALQSTATRVTDGDGRITGYRLNGNKQWISNGGYADVYTFLARAPDGPSWFIVERGAQGLSHGLPEVKHGIRLSNTATVSADDVYVDADRLVGLKEGQGLLQAQLVFGYTRLMVAAFGLGAGLAALDRAIPYSEQRLQGGGPLSQKQGYTHKLIVPHFVALEAARACIEETAERLDTGAGHLNTEGAVAKYLATEAGHGAADAAIQALGGYGYTKEYVVEKIQRDVRITRIYEGTSEIMEMTIARDRWQLHLKSRGQYYHDQARELEALHAKKPQVGAGVAALAHHSLAAILERARERRLTRHQHVLFRLGELIALTESSACLARRAVRALEERLVDRADRKLGAEPLGALSRVHARRVALKVAEDGMQLVTAAEPPGQVVFDELARTVGLAAVHEAQAGLLGDMDRVADALYQRA